MIYTTYKGARLDLEFYKGKTTKDYSIEVTNDDGTPYVLSIYTSLACKVFYRKDGELIFSPTVVAAGSVIDLDETMAQSGALQKRDYWYEIYGVYASLEQELLTFGIHKVA